MVRGTTRVAAVLGDPIAHSRSPQLLGAAFAAVGLDAIMVPLRVPAAALGDVVRALAATDALGASVTVPHKQAVVAHCVGLTERAARAGAVNSLRFVPGSAAVTGDNTDGAGLLADLAAQRVAVAGRQVVVLGAGGAARAVETALADAGARTIVVARRPELATWLPASQVRPWSAAAHAAAWRDAAVIVDATSRALADASDTLDDLPLDALAGNACVVSLVYHRRPALLTAAAARGCQVIDGRGMLLEQAALSFEAWTGQPAPRDAMRTALA